MHTEYTQIQNYNPAEIFAGAQRIVCDCERSGWVMQPHGRQATSPSTILSSSIHLFFYPPPPCVHFHPIRLVVAVGVADAPFKLPLPASELLKCVLLTWQIGGLLISPKYVRKHTTPMFRKKNLFPDLVWRNQQAFYSHPLNSRHGRKRMGRGNGGLWRGQSWRHPLC